MRIESLTLFLAIIQTGSFRRAAQDMYISQQGLSKSIQSLESELNCTLFDRSSKRVSLTDAGRLLEPYARSIVESSHEFETELTGYHQAIARQLSKHLTILASPLVTNRIFYSLRKELAAAGLDDITPIERSLSKIVRHIMSAEEPEFALVDIITDDVQPLLDDHPGLIYDQVYSIRITVLGAPELLPSDRSEITIEELKAFPIAYQNAPNVNHFIEEILKIDPDNVVMRVSNASMIYDAVRKGEAVTFGDDFTDYADDHYKGLISIPISDIAPTSLGFIYRADRPLSDDERAYIVCFKSMMHEIDRNRVGRWLLHD